MNITQLSYVCVCLSHHFLALRGAFVYFRRYFSSAFALYSSVQSENTPPRVSEHSFSQLVDSFDDAVFFCNAQL